MLTSRQAGQIPFGAAFTAKQGGIKLDSDPVPIGSILCYIAEELE
jgi:hypothetical protein